MDHTPTPPPSDTSENSLQEPKCPVNHFGKGVNYIVPQTDDAIAEYEEQWNEWESEHPDDPTGEKAWAKWEEYKQSLLVKMIDPTYRDNTATAVVERQRRLAHDKPLRYDRSNKEIYRFYLPVELHTMLKRRAAEEGRAMSNILAKLIEHYIQS